MSSAIHFARYAGALVSSYSASYTDTLVWWFASSNQTVQTDAISQICFNKYYSVKDAIYILWSLNSTFVLDQTAQTKMISYVDKLSNGSMTAVYINKNPVTAYETFFWNPYTPKSFLWFQDQIETQQRIAINTACYYSTGFPASFWNATIQFYRRSKADNFKESVDNAMSTCVGISQFLESPDLESSKSWLEKQPYETQRTSILQLCSKSTNNSTQLYSLFEYFNLTEQRIQIDQVACLNTYHLSPTTIYRSYHPESNDGLVWIASQNGSIQSKAVGNLCMGMVLTKQQRVYTLPQIFKMLDTIKSYLIKTELLTNRVLAAIDSCPPFYEGKGLSLFGQHAEYIQTQTWLSSQNSSIQIQFFEILCSNFTAYNDSDLMLLFHQYGAHVQLPLDVQYSMTSCPRIWSQVEFFSTPIQVFWGLFAVSCVGIVVFLKASLYEIQVTKSKQKLIQRLFSPFNVATFLCFLFNGMDDFCNAIMWHRAAISFVTTTDMKTGQQFLNLSAEFFSNAWALSYMYFCWIRSESILGSVWPKSFKWIKFAFLVSPICVLSPIVARGVSMIADVEDSHKNLSDRRFAMYLFYLQAISASTLMLFDAILLSTFTRYIQKVHADMDETISSRFLIISRYGIATSLLCFLFAGMSVVQLFNSDLAFNFGFRLVYFGFKHLVTFLLLLMKVFLVFDSVAEASKKSEVMSKPAKQSSAYILQTSSDAIITK